MTLGCVDPAKDATSVSPAVGFKQDNGPQRDGDLNCEPHKKKMGT